MRRSTAVFSGEVVGIGELPQEGEGMMPPLAPVTFDVKGGKGVSGESVVVHGQSPGASCGLDFERGEAYLVFAGGAGRDAGGPLETGLCSTTRLVSEETARNMLGPPTNSLPETGGVSPERAERKMESTRRVATTAAPALLAAGALFAGRAMRGPER